MTIKLKTALRRRGAWIAALALALGVAPLGMQMAVQARQMHHAGSHHAAARHPISGLRVIPLRVGEGPAAHAFRVEVASNFAEQEKGLMFRKTLGPAEGMIFPQERPQPAAFWMKNTVIPLDIVFVGTDHRIVNVAANARPYDLSPIYSAGPVICVLELAGGRAAQLGIGTGDLVTW